MYKIRKRIKPDLNYIKHTDVYHTKIIVTYTSPCYVYWNTGVSIILGEVS